MLFEHYDQKQKCSIFTFVQYIVKASEGASIQNNFFDMVENVIGKGS